MTFSIYEMVFRGELAQAALDRAGREDPRAKFKEESEIRELLGTSLLEPARVESAQSMAVVYYTIAAFENSVRDFITKALREKYESDWWQTGVSEKIRKKAEDRREKEKKIRWHQPRGQHLIYYTDFGDLANIMRQNLSLFEDFIPDIEWVEKIISTVELSRNVIMHSGELEIEDIERIGVYIKDWIKQVG